MSTLTARLDRTDSNTSWGFRMAGGKDFGTPLQIQRVTPGSLAAKCGVQTGDYLLNICENATDGMRHKEAQQVIILAGNSLVLKLQRGGGGMPVAAPAPPQPSQYSSQAYVPQSNGTGPTATPGTAAAYPRTNPHQPNLNPNEYQAPAQNFNNAPTPWQGVAPNLPNHQYNPYVQNITSATNSFGAMNIGGQPSGPGSESPPPLPASAPPGSAPPGSTTQLPSHTNLYITPSGMSSQSAVSSSSLSPKSASPRSITGVSPVKFATNKTDFNSNSIKPVSNSPKFNGLKYSPKIGGNSTTSNNYMTPMKALDIPQQPRLWQGHQTSDSSPHRQASPNMSMSPSRKLSPSSNKLETPKTTTSGLSPTMAAILSEEKSTNSSDDPRGLSVSNTQSRSFTFLQNLIDSGQEIPTASLSKSPSSDSSSTGSQTQSVTQSVTHQQYNSPIGLYAKHRPQNSLDGQQRLNLDIGGPGADYSAPKPAAAPYQPPARSAPAPAPAAVPAQTHAAPSASKSAWQPRIPTGPRKMRVMKAGEAKSMPSGGNLGGRIPCCSNCHMQIRGPFVLALDKSWCPDHFVCSNPNCLAPLVDTGFVEEDGQLFCERDYQQYFAPRCHKCGQAIMGDCVNALKETFHPQCFTCTHCNQSIGTGSFHIEEGKTYCEKDWQAMFQTKCYGCQFPIEPGDRWVEALNENWHSECFNCSTCQINLEGQQFFAKAGKPFCKKHAMGR